MPIFAFGETGAALGTCFAVADGSYVVTTADNVLENVGPKTKRNMTRAVVISPWTGDIYRARLEKVDEPSNLAVLKLDRPGLPAAALAKSPKEIPAATLGQLLNENETAGGRWPSVMYSFLRVEKGDTTRYVLTEWRGERAFITEARGHRWLFLKDVTPKDKAPGGGPVVREGEGVVGVYISRFIVEGGGKSEEQRLCVPLKEMLSFLEGAGLKSEALYSPARPSLEKAADADAAFQLAWRGISKVIGGRWESAVADARALAEMRPKSAQAHLLYGVALSGAGKREEALKAFDAAERLDARIPGIYLDRGAAYAALGRKKEAEQDFKKAMELDPGDIRAPMWLSGLLAADEARRDDAVTFAEQAVRTAPDSPAALLNLASVLGLKKEHERAIIEIKRALEIAPEFIDARAMLAAAYRAAGRTDEAEKEYRALVKADPKNPGPLLELADFLIELGKKEDARKLISQALELNPPEELKKAAEELSKKAE